jgi:hypothetical protein
MVNSNFDQYWIHRTIRIKIELDDYNKFKLYQISVSSIHLISSNLKLKGKVAANIFNRNKRYHHSIQED